MLVDKKTYFRERGSIGEFPSFDVLQRKECETVKSRILKSFSVDAHLDKYKATFEIRSKSELALGNFDEATLALEGFLRYAIGYISSDIYLNFCHFDEINRMKFSDFATYFSDIWFPGADDLDIFDVTFSWIIQFGHENEIFLLKA